MMSKERQVQTRSNAYGHDMPTKRAIHMPVVGRFALKSRFLDTIFGVSDEHQEGSAAGG